MRKIITVVIILTIGILIFAIGKKSDKQALTSENRKSKTENQILYYTCGMHPSVKVSPQEYEKGSKSCPICKMDLVPVYKQDSSSAKGESTVTVSQRGLSLAGVQTYKVGLLPLFKEIRTVGLVAYDPQLRTAQQEYIQALNTHAKVSQSEFEDAKERAAGMVESTKIKLELLGLDQESIKELETAKTLDKSLILPGESAWIYADFYEYESAWPKVGDKVEVISEADPSIIFQGQIRSIDPVLKQRARTLRAKISVENKEKLLKPNMYVDVILKSDLGLSLAMPRSAVLDTGKRRIVYVDLGGGNFGLREVRLGPLVEGAIDGVSEDFYPLVEGVKEGESVVTKGNFLIDSQSQLGAASSSYGGALGSEASAHKH